MDWRDWQELLRPCAPLNPLFPGLAVVVLGSVLIALLLTALAGWGVGLASFLTLLAGGLLVLSINRQ